MMWIIFGIASRSLSSKCEIRRKARCRCYRCWRCSTK